MTTVHVSIARPVSMFLSDEFGLGWSCRAETEFCFRFRPSRVDYEFSLKRNGHSTFWLLSAASSQVSMVSLVFDCSRYQWRSQSNQLHVHVSRSNDRICRLCWQICRFDWLNFLALHPSRNVSENEKSPRCWLDKHKVIQKSFVLTEKFLDSLLTTFNVSLESFARRKKLFDFRSLLCCETSIRRFSSDGKTKWKTFVRHLNNVNDVTWYKKKQVLGEVAVRSSLSDVSI